MKLADGKVTLHAGDCLEVLATLAENSIDAVVTDPPYELGFMGKSWDASGIAFCPDTWRLVWRVLKPGGHLVAFGAPKNYHRLACAIEDAGFEIRDSLMWVFGSGFPKSLDVSKAIDKRRASNDLIRPWLKSLGSREEIASAAGVTARQVDHWLGENTPCPQTLTESRFVSICRHFNTMPGWADEMFERVGDKIGEIKHSRSGGDDFAKRPGSISTSRIADINAPATDAAREWVGYGTALKPAYEPIVLARKPLSEGTVAANVLRWGTGALNIDATRIGNEQTITQAKKGMYGSGSAEKMRDHGFRPYTIDNRNQAEKVNPPGRWPANLCHDGSQGVLDLFPQTAPSSGRARNNSDYKSVSKGAEKAHVTFGHDDNGGSAARFFYCAKAGKQDRAGSKHPTVKPVNLMRWLVRMVTPPGGTVLDPFAGSGTTGLAAHLEGFEVQLIEREAEYQADIRSRFDV